MDPRLCILLAHGSIEGTASSTGPHGIAVAGPVGVDHLIKNAAKLFSYKNKTKRTILTLTLSLESPSISSSKKRPN
jgi:hypothetical protein